MVEKVYVKKAKAEKYSKMDSASFDMVRIGKLEKVTVSPIKAPKLPKPKIDL